MTFTTALIRFVPDLPEIRTINDGQTFRSGTNAITPQVTDQSRNQIRNDLTWVRGNHTFRFGGNYERTSITGLFVFANPARIRIFEPLGDGETEDDFLDAPVFDLSYGIGDAPCLSIRREANRQQPLPILRQR